MNLEASADIAVAGGTIVLAFFTQRAAAARRNAAGATKKAAEAARDEADATVKLAQEAREDRELAWRPHLGVLLGKPAAGPDFVSIETTVTNVGNGPALDCRIWLYSADRWAWRDLEPLASRKRLPLPEPFWLRHQGGPLPVPEGMFDSPQDDQRHRDPQVIVATRTDVLGNR